VTTAPAVGPLQVSVDWPAGGELPEEHTCRGAGTSPALRWGEPPEGTQELALYVYDETVQGVVWLLAGIPATASELTPGSVPLGAVSGLNVEDGLGWAPPCPGPGETRSLRFALYALSSSLGATQGVTAGELVPRIEAATLAGGEARAIVTGR
jgi:hypothetical protein